MHGYIIRKRREQPVCPVSNIFAPLQNSNPFLKCKDYHLPVYNNSYKLLYFIHA